jgi:hypothetical protein
VADPPLGALTGTPDPRNGPARGALAARAALCFAVLLHADGAIGRSAQSLVVEPR